MTKTINTVRSSAYVTTLNPLNVKDMLKLDALRAKVSRDNRNSEKKLRVVVRGRDPIARKFINSAGIGRTIGYDGCGNIVNGLANAQRLDVYIYERRS